MAGTAGYDPEYQARVREIGQQLLAAGLRENIDANLAHWPPLSDAQLADLASIIESHRASERAMAWRQRITAEP